MEYVPGPGLHMVRISDAEVLTHAHVLCLAERREMRMVKAFLDSIVPDAEVKRPRASAKAA